MFKQKPSKYNRCLVITIILTETLFYNNANTQLIWSIMTKHIHLFQLTIQNNLSIHLISDFFFFFVILRILRIIQMKIVKGRKIYRFLYAYIFPNICKFNQQQLTAVSLPVRLYKRTTRNKIHRIIIIRTK